MPRRPPDGNPAGHLNVEFALLDPAAHRGQQVGGAEAGLAEIVAEWVADIAASLAVGDNDARAMEANRGVGNHRAHGVCSNICSANSEAEGIGRSPPAEEGT